MQEIYKIQSNVYISGHSYFSLLPSEVLGNDKYNGGIFILHAEGNPKTLYRIWKDMIEPDIKGKDLYFTMKDYKYFRNHVEEIEEGLYKYKGDRQWD